MIYTHKDVGKCVIVSRLASNPEAVYVNALDGTHFKRGEKKLNSQSILVQEKDLTPFVTDVFNGAILSQTAINEKFTRMADLLASLGACPDCLQVAKMDSSGPWSYCDCGTGEDYAKRPLQRLQLQDRMIQALHDKIPKEAGSSKRQG